jgi:hypothetical protein
MLSDENLLQDEDVAPLVVIDIEGLEAAEAVTEKTGLSLEALLAAHARSPMHSYAFRDWLLVDYAPVRPTMRIMSRWDRVMDPVLARLEEGGE